MYLGTTTWKKRNLELLSRTAETAYKIHIKSPLILDYGPGGIVRPFLRWLPERGHDTWNAQQEIQRGLLKIIEALTRKTGLFSLATSEPFEIAAVFQDLHPTEVCVLDIEQRVLQAIQREIGNFDGNVTIRCQLADVQSGVLETGDIVIAYHIVERTRNPNLALKNIAASTNIGGLLSTTVSLIPPGFEKLGDGVYQRVA